MLFLEGGVAPLRTARQAAVRRIEAWSVISVETFRPAERKHALHVRSFHRMQSFHVGAARGTAAPREPGMRRAWDCAAAAQLTALPLKEERDDEVNRAHTLVVPPVTGNPYQPTG
jgi:hypothetical protein